MSQEFPHYSPADLCPSFISFVFFAFFVAKLKNITQLHGDILFFLSHKERKGRKEGKRENPFKKNSLFFSIASLRSLWL
ncbi:MAG: hypothetical protein IJQ31_07335 [Thermoguttaceae bacterium]|nr:hypothetical protein [Thermoguttaceae bacterium]